MDNGGSVFFWENVKLVWTGHYQNLLHLRFRDTEGTRVVVHKRLVVSVMIVGYDTFIFFFCVFLRIDSEIERKQLFCYVIKCWCWCCESLLQKPGT